jgi:DNA-directed RNA polymerase subunit omega
LIYPSADTIEQKVGSRYSLVVLAAKRAKQIKEGAPVLIDTASTNPLTIALEEIAAGKVTVGEAAPVEALAIVHEESSTTPSPIASIISDLTSAGSDEDDDEDEELAEEEAADVA